MGQARALRERGRPGRVLPGRRQPGHEGAAVSKCPVQAECLKYALAADEEFGIWGGLDPRERQNLKRRRARRRAAEEERRSGGAA